MGTSEVMGPCGGVLSVPAGFLPSPVQSHPLHPPAVVLHHDLQRGQALLEEQIAPEGECVVTQGRCPVIIWCVSE